MENTVKTDSSGIVATQHGLLAHFSILPAGSGALSEPCAPGEIYRPLGPLNLDNELDALLADLWPRPVGGSTISSLRTDMEDIVESDQWSLICPFRLGYHIDDEAHQHGVGDGSNELMQLFSVSQNSMSVERAVAVAIEARKVLTR